MKFHESLFQLRVHCDYLGHTIVGDFTYSNRKDVLSPRMFLHAHRLIFRKLYTFAQCYINPKFIPNCKEQKDDSKSWKLNWKVEPRGSGYCCRGQFYSRELHWLEEKWYCMWYKWCLWSDSLWWSSVESCRGFSQRLRLFLLFSRVMAFWPTDRRQSLSSLYEKIYKEDDSENLWASLLKGFYFILLLWII